ncbi:MULTISPECIES: pyrimidine reductase family protein [Actinosynnema]|uniref:pyrimidine reductase family protein n=1 Tax=Actinosynnema TaxID=40566 RepID=UPI0020A4A0C0|nr:pyrimidine reductase family protein [Actinosynnema pretiosum]MCP2095518.1 Pyrimidine reductase, riboflavin biosynthesis [Actinosynnema pretiosum]
MAGSLTPCWDGSVQKLWPGSGAESNITDAELERLYDHPADLDRPWVQVNFVASADGAMTVDGRSGGLGGAADQKVFALGRDLADVVLVGAGTASAEGYRGVVAGKARAERRARLGLAPIPPIAVVSGRCSLEPDSPLLTDTLVPPIVLTTSEAPARRRAELSEAGADVVVAGESSVHPALALRALDERGLRRVDCEGGPALFASLIAADLVDVLCLTVAPLLVAGGAGRIGAGVPSAVPRGMELSSALHDEGYLMLRYARAR